MSGAGLCARIDARDAASATCSVADTPIIAIDASMSEIHSQLRFVDTRPTHASLHESAR
jgi:hypothetical protein